MTPARTARVEELQEQTDEYELPYVSKSRVMQWVKNPEHFRLKYLEGVREPETDAMRRGTHIHESIEHYYNACRRYQRKLRPAESEALPDTRGQWAKYIEPYLSNFFRWEAERWAKADSTDGYLPVAVEEEHWRDDLLDMGPPWMGIADAVLPAESVPSVPSTDGVVIVDFKTGSVPYEDYRQDGIFTELAYYQVLFEDEYDIVATAAYYPREHETLVQPTWTDASERARENVFANAKELIEVTAGYDGATKFEANEGPLCGWSPDADDRSAFYGLCSQCTWNVPVENEETFRQMVDEGYSTGEIADDLGTSKRAVSYWKNKLNL